MVSVSLKVPLLSLSLCGVEFEVFQKIVQSELTGCLAATAAFGYISVDYNCFLVNIFCRFIPFCFLFLSYRNVNPCVNLKLVEEIINLYRVS